MVVKKGLIIIILAFVHHILDAQSTFEIVNDIPVAGESFSPLQDPWAGGLNSPQYSTCFLDDDSDPDLVVFERTSNRVKTFLYKNGQYEYNPDYEAFFPDDLMGWMILRDYNCDGRKDIFTHSRFGIRVFENTRTGSVPEWTLTEQTIFTEGSSGQVNLQVNITDIPGIDDLDNDGDLDILVYKFSTGGGIEYHKNLSIENTGNCGLTYRRESRRWGDFEECECDVFAFGTNECNTGSKLNHAGGKTILTLDLDNDQDKEVLIGQEDCEPLYFLENKGTPQDALMTEFSNEFPSADQKIEFFIFPSAFYEDVTGDNVPDLISSTNFDINDDNRIDFKNSSWLYENTGTVSNPVFNRISKNFLQSQMIDVGENAVPTFNDYDNDGDQDMFVANRGTYQDRVFAGSIDLYENTGGLLNPQFQLVESNFLGLRSKSETDLKIQFTDLNRDGNDDLVVAGTSNNETKLHVYFNEGGFNFRTDNPVEIDVEINVNDNFHFTEINGDQNIDLLIGRENGRLDFYRGRADLNFEGPQEGFYDILEDFQRKRLTITVADIERDGNPDLLTGDERGFIMVYDDFLSSLNSPKSGRSVSYNNELIEEDQKLFGRQFFISRAEIFGGNSAGLAIGTRSGGIQIIRTNNGDDPSDTDQLSILVYPNPVGNGRIVIESNQSSEIVIYNRLGQPVQSNISVEQNGSVIIDTSTLPSGLYIIKSLSSEGESSKSFIVL